MRTDNRYAALEASTDVEDPVEITPEPLPQRTGQRHRRPPYVPPSSSDSEGSGVRQQPAAVPPSAQFDVHLSEGGSTSDAYQNHPPASPRECWAAP